MSFSVDDDDEDGRRTSSMGIEIGSGVDHDAANIGMGDCMLRCLGIEGLQCRRFRPGNYCRMQEAVALSDVGRLVVKAVPQYQIVHANMAFLSMLGTLQTKDTIVGKSVDSIMRPLRYKQRDLSIASANRNADDCKDELTGSRVQAQLLLGNTNVVVEALLYPVVKDIQRISGDCGIGPSDVSHILLQIYREISKQAESTIQGSTQVKRPTISGDTSTNDQPNARLPTWINKHHGSKEQFLAAIHLDSSRDNQKKIGRDFARAEKVYDASIAQQIVNQAAARRNSKDTSVWGKAKKLLHDLGYHNKAEDEARNTASALSNRFVRPMHPPIDSKLVTIIPASQYEEENVRQAMTITDRYLTDSLLSTPFMGHLAKAYEKEE